MLKMFAGFVHWVYKILVQDLWLKYVFSDVVLPFLVKYTNETHLFIDDNYTKLTYNE